MQLTLIVYFVLVFVALGVSAEDHYPEDELLCYKKLHQYASHNLIWINRSEYPKLNRTQCEYALEGLKRMLPLTCNDLYIEFIIFKINDVRMDCFIDNACVDPWYSLCVGSNITLDRSGETTANERLIFGVISAFMMVFVWIPGIIMYLFWKCTESLFGWFVLFLLSNVIAVCTVMYAHAQLKHSSLVQ